MPLTWFALAGEFLETHQSPYEDRYRDELMNAHVPEMRAGGQAYAAVRALTA